MLLLSESELIPQFPSAIVWRKKKQQLKVSLFQNVLWVSSFRPKNQRNFFKNFGPSLQKEVK